MSRVVPSLAVILSDDDGDFTLASWRSCRTMGKSTPSQIESGRPRKRARIVSPPAAGAASRCRTLKRKAPAPRSLDASAPRAKRPRLEEKEKESKEKIDTAPSQIINLVINPDSAKSLSDHEPVSLQSLAPKNKPKKRSRKAAVGHIPNPVSKFRKRDVVENVCFD